ncbi:hypothetical protein [Modestobacter roseus]|uniref:Trypsin-like peptidase n=1 Tax=Modestobacter roseus TaxID=1181884 RepID=A0A562ITU8_9ACTN|nr:hypothetical protein [Modestobacter roseus]MQA33671.1 hypothetical protein [Modestobacter roseus]TWH74378.1 hypothetical protein JD78_02913 [Modestobacter roseus]
MLPDSARELKHRLSRRLAEGPPGVVARSNGATATWSGVALGLTPIGPEQVHLAVRVIGPADAAVVLAGLGEAALAEVDVRAIGVVRALGSPTPGSPTPGSPTPGSPTLEELRRRTRPLRPGLSIGHERVTAGTLGGFVRRPGVDGLLALSNNHVLAASDAGAVGDPVLQPGVADGGVGTDRVGVLAGAVRFEDRPGNQVDAAVALLDPGVVADPTGYPGGALLPTVAAPDTVDPEELVEKVGRTTGHTRGRVTAVEVDGVGVQYDRGVFTFDDQIEVEGLTGAFSAGGDSGSLIWRSADRAPLGLLFAGSELGGSAGGGVTFANPLATVLRRLGVEWAAG